MNNIQFAPNPTRACTMRSIVVPIMYYLDKEYLGTFDIHLPAYQKLVYEIARKNGIEKYNRYVVGTLGDKYYLDSLSLNKHTKAALNNYYNEHKKEIQLA